jgi:hypothetical protein
MLLAISAAGPEDAYGAYSLTFSPERDGVLSGFVGWFDARLSDSVTLSTGPDAPETHWSQTWFPFPPRAVKAGELLKVSVDMTRDPAEPRHLSVELRCGETVLRYTLE